VLHCGPFVVDWRLTIRDLGAVDVDENDADASTASDLLDSADARVGSPASLPVLIASLVPGPRS
jgi:hypothetical protein